MKKIIFILSLFLLSNNCLAAGSSDGNYKTDLYKAAKKLILKAKKLEKKDKVEKALTLYSKARFKLQKVVDLKKNKVNGLIKLKLYKGNIIIISRQTKSNAYSVKKVSFEENKAFNKSNVERFINLHKKKL